MTNILSSIVPEPSLVMAQATNPFSAIGANLGINFGSSLINILGAVAILIVGWIISGIVKALVKKLLGLTDIDNRIASWVTGQRGGDFPIEEWIGTLVCWLIRLFAIVAFLDALKLEAVSAPLNSLLNEITSFIPNLIGAGILLGVAWVVATIVKTIVVKALDALNLDKRLEDSIGESSDLGVSETIGNALYWFVFLFASLPVLKTLGLNEALNPLEGMLNELLAMLPNIFGAVLIGAVGWFIAQIVRRIVTNLLIATGADSIGEKVGIASNGGKDGLSSIIGTVVFVFILIPTATAALEALKIAAISEPAIAMLNQVLDIVPKIFAAGVVLALFFMAGKFVSELVVDVLSDLGFNNFLQWLGITSTPSTVDIPDSDFGETEQPTVIQTESLSSKTPSEFVGIVVLTAIMLVGSLTAVDILGIPALESVIGIVMAIAGRVLVGLIIFAIGLYFANLAHKLVLASGTHQAGFLAQAARVMVIIFVGSLALTEMGIAANVVNLAFGLSLGALAVAFALAFGLGGREVAREQLRSLANSLKGKDQ